MTDKQQVLADISLVHILGVVKWLIIGIGSYFRGGAWNNW
jgi:hypothetical protein